MKKTCFQTLRARRRRLGVVEQERSLLGGGGGGGGVQREEVVLVRRRLVPCADRRVRRWIHASARAPMTRKSHTITIHTTKAMGAMPMHARVLAHVPWMPIIVARQSQRPAIAAWTHNSPGPVVASATATAVGRRPHRKKPRAREAAAPVDRRVLDHVTRESFPTLSLTSPAPTLLWLGLASPSPSRPPLWYTLPAMAGGSARETLYTRSTTRAPGFLRRARARARASADADADAGGG